jgi:hypothetical protein
MYQLILLTNAKKPKPNQPFTPSWTINGQLAKGRTFGLPLHGQSNQYSRSLTDLVQSCLYERPEHRPPILELKEAVRKGYLVALNDDATLDAWADFLPPSPPKIGHPSGRPLCKGTFRNGNPCTHPANAGGFCGVHKKQRPQPRRNATRKS